ncbi:hypothetical protein OIU74_015409 [Salix koriyanagi]|uniref:VOC domain-containing protein n=1 Tax=Salix koriyanagi TaxID=2511006 RepID=A0A9Q0PXZ0_9ROSI|nr:hypothetical protein OIU74_015409 [Salix koriyanagi]
MASTGEIDPEEIERRASPSLGRASLPLHVNHVAFACKSVPESVKFYEDVLGFVVIKRPDSLPIKGAWLFNYGVGIHLLQSDKAPKKKSEIDPTDNHLSFECSDMELVESKLKEKNVEYKPQVIQEGSITVNQLFFHDPDGYMVEICNCQNLPPVAAGRSLCSQNLPVVAARRSLCSQNLPVVPAELSLYPPRCFLSFYMKKNP